MAGMELCQLQYFDKYVARTMRCLPDKFAELCHRHLAVLLDLSGDKLEILLSGHEEHKKKKSGLSSVGMFKRKGRSQGLFGLPLTDEGVCLMMPLIQFLKMETNVTKEGLFRKPGNKSRMTTLRELLIAHGGEVNIDPEVFSAHDVASVLKEFIRELPEPLLTVKHLEAHMQISALGQHAKIPNEIASYSSRKLSAVQLLMLLLPSPAQILTMHLVKLLKKTATSPKSLMTPATLGTIFAPIFFIDKKVQATDLLSQISKTAPAASFMIDNAHQLFQAPKEVVTELTRFWKSMKQSFLHTGNRKFAHMQRSLSGQTLYPDVDGVEGNLSRCDDGTSNISAELANVLMRMQAQKDKTKKYFDAPEFCASLCRRSRSIGSTIRKRLPSLKQIRNRRGDSLSSRVSSSSAPRSDYKIVTSTKTGQIECSTETSEAKSSSQFPKPGQKRHHSPENCLTAASSSSSNPPVKQNCQETTTSKITMNDNQKHLTNAGCQARLPPNGHSTKTVSSFVERRNLRVVTSSLEDSATCDIGNKCSKRHICHLDRKTEATNSDILQKKLAPAQIGSGDPLAVIKITKSATGSRKSKPATNTHQQTSSRSRIVTSTKIGQIECSTETSEAKSSSQFPKPGQKRHHSPENCLTAASSSNNNPPVKQKCQETATSKITVNGNQKHLKKAGCEAQLPPNGRFTKTVSSCVERFVTSSLEDSATCDIGNKCSKRHISHLDKKTEATNSDILQENLAPAQTGSGDSLAVIKITKSATGSRKSKPATNTHQQTSRRSRTKATASATIRLVQDDILETSL